MKTCKSCRWVGLSISHRNCNHANSNDLGLDLIGTLTAIEYNTDVKGASCKYYELSLSSRLVRKVKGLLK